MNGFVRFSYVLVFLSGMTGLIYQVTWQKYISTLVGSHASSAAAVLALFFLFLSFGYAFFGRFAARIMKSQLLLYAVLEFLIGLYALYSHQIFEGIFRHMVGQVGFDGGTGGLSYVLLLSGAFMFLPTFLMGGTIPVLTQGLSSNFDIGTRTHALIYGTNTLGAFVGCLLAGFYLIENLGLDGTLLVAGNANILIAILAWGVVKRSGLSFEGPKTETLSGATPGMSWGLLFISFCSGYYTFSLEKLVIRMAGLSLGSTAYTYSIIVGAFIFAIGLGSIILSLNKKFEKPAVFAFVQLGSLVGVIALHQVISQWPELVLRLTVLVQPHPMNFSFYWALVLSSFVFILFLPVGLIGANLPLLFGLLKSNGVLLSQTVGRLYMVNCLGATLGAIVGGYWIFNYLEADPAYRSLVVVVFLATVVAIGMIFSGRQRVLLFGASGLLLAIFFVLPSWQTKDFVPGLYLYRSIGKSVKLQAAVENNKKGFDIIFSRFDPNTFATVAEMQDLEKNRALFVNGKPDAHTSGDHTVRAMAALIPMALQPQTIEKVFVIGLGAGLSTAIVSSLQEVKQVDVAEISEGVVQSLPFFEKFNYGLKDRMQKVNVEVGDAYRILMQKGQYDLIMCEPSNPWVTGVDKLYSKEFYEIGRSRLSKSGYYVQWLPTSAMDVDTLSVVFKTFQSVFPHTLVFSAQGGALTLVGSQSEFSLNTEVSERRYQETKQIYEKYGISSPYDIYLYQLLTPLMLKLITDRAHDVHSLFAPVLEYRASRAHFSDMGSNISEMLYESVPLPVPSSEPTGQFIYERAGIQIPVAAFSAAYNKAAQEMIHHRLKILSLLQIKDPKHKLLETEASWFSAFRPFLQSQELSLKAKPKSQERLTELQGHLWNYKLLIALGLRPSLSKLVPVLERDCQTDDCYAEKRLAVLGLGRLQVSQKVAELPAQKATSEQVSLVTAEWEKIKELYKKLGAY